MSCGNAGIPAENTPKVALESALRNRRATAVAPSPSKLTAAEKVAALARSHLFSGAPPEALELLARVAEFRPLDRGQMVFIAGDPANGLFIVVAGSIRAFRMNAKGKEQTIHVEGAGATLAEVPVFDDGTYPATAVAEVPSAVLYIGKADVQRFLMANPAVALNALRLMAARLRRHAELADSLALKDVGRRLAQFLLSEARARNANRLSFSNQQLAARVGSVREVVSRTLARLASQGLIDIDARARGITILNVPALESFAENES